MSPRTPPPGCPTNTVTLNNNLGQNFGTPGKGSPLSIGPPSGLAAQEIAPLSSSTDSPSELKTLKTSEPTSKHFFNFDAQFDKLFELVEAYEKKKQDSQT